MGEFVLYLGGGGGREGTDHVEILKTFIQTNSSGETILDARAYNDLALIGELGSELGCGFVDHIEDCNNGI